MQRIISDLGVVFQKDSFIFNVVAGIIAWLSPSLELLLLLYGLTTLDWMLDVRQFFKNDSPKIDLWAKVTRPTIEKITLYTVMALAVFATQQHLFKQLVPLYTIIMAVPISAELVSICTTVEKNTGIKVVTRIHELFNSFFGGKSNGQS